MSSEHLHMIPRLEFVNNHFPQAACAGCYFRKTCVSLLSAPHAQMAGDFWLVSDDNGKCARNHVEPVPQDIQMLRQREMLRLSSMSSDESVDVTRTPRLSRASE